MVDVVWCREAHVAPVLRLGLCQVHRSSWTGHLSLAAAELLSLPNWGAFAGGWHVDFITHDVCGVVKGVQDLIQVEVYTSVEKHPRCSSGEVFVFVAEYLFHPRLNLSSDAMFPL